MIKLSQAVEAEMKELADQAVKDLDFDEDCLTERTHPGTPVGECTYHEICGCTIHDTFKRGFKAGYQIASLDSSTAQANLEWLVYHAIETASISKARGAELLKVPLIDMDSVLAKYKR